MARELPDAILTPTTAPMRIERTCNCKERGQISGFSARSLRNQSRDRAGEGGLACIYFARKKPDRHSDSCIVYVSLHPSQHIFNCHLSTAIAHRRDHTSLRIVARSGPANATHHVADDPPHTKPPSPPRPPSRPRCSQTRQAPQRTSTLELQSLILHPKQDMTSKHTGATIRSSLATGRGGRSA
jgi:hypothetical protein